MATNPNAVVRFYASDMTLNLHSDASYSSAGQGRSRAGGDFFLGSIAGLDVLCRHTKKIICSETERATTTDLNIRMKSSQRGAFDGTGHKFISSFFGELFLKR